MTPMPRPASATHAVRQPQVSMKICVRGTKTNAPMGIPSPTKAIAVPRRRTNHFSIGTEVTSAPGPLMPTRPITANSATRCHTLPMKASAIIAPPVARAATGSKTREPNLSSSQPTGGLVTELATWWAVWAQPK